jgi:hypothetical protein
VEIFIFSSVNWWSMTMKCIRTGGFFLPLCELAISLTMLAGCGNSTTPAPDGGDGLAADAGPEASAPPPAWPPASLQAMQFANFGDLGPGGTKDLSAWRSVGLNLDGGQGAGLRCQPQTGISPEVQQRGDNGIENSFGRNVVPVFDTSDPPLSINVDNSFAAGDTTLLLAFYDLPSAADAEHLQAAILLGAGADRPSDTPGTTTHRPLASSWTDGTGLWNLTSTALVSEDPVIPRTLLRGSLKTHQWASEPADILLVFPIQGASLPVTLHRGHLRGTFSPDHRQLHDGVLAGLLAIEEFVAQFTKFAPRFNTSFCAPGSVDFVVKTVFRPAVDTLIDGKVDPTRPCDAISFGMSFEAVSALPGQVIPPPLADSVACESH